MVSEVHELIPMDPAGCGTESRLTWLRRRPASSSQCRLSAWRACLPLRAELQSRRQQHRLRRTASRDHARRATDTEGPVSPMTRLYRLAAAQTRPTTTAVTAMANSPSKTQAVIAAPESKAAPMVSETVAAIACAKRLGAGAAASRGTPNTGAMRWL